jgi:aminoglycoside phosphotransferase (APT) family kinase protein
VSTGHFRRRRGDTAPSDVGAASGASARARRLAALSGGREAEIVDLGDGTVLRRYRSSGSPGYEALAMEHARKHGFPVPEVVEVRDNALVLERIDGPTMLHELRRRPWHARRHMRTLAELHKQLHAIEAPAGIDSAGDGDTLLHLDFHPLNVLLSVTGPVVIDWPNARSGDAALDVAMTWVICATSGGAFGRMLIRPYLSQFDPDETRGALPAAAERRLADPHVTDAERAAVRRLTARGRSG